MQDSRRQFNDKTIYHIEYIDSMYKQKIKKNKSKNFQDKISSIISSIIKHDQKIESIKAEYDK